MGRFVLALYGVLKVRYLEVVTWRTSGGMMAFVYDVVTMSMVLAVAYTP